MSRRMIYTVALFLAFITTSSAQPQDCYWQQQADYQMEVTLDVRTHIMEGTQQLVYTNNSPDTLYEVFYHLYFNAFQPGSEMDAISHQLEDPDRRVLEQLPELAPSQQGYQNILDLKQDGNPLTFEVRRTLLHVPLASALLPGKSTTLEMEFETQVPLLTRRGGRDSKEGIRYTMTQWYPKLAEYDHDGWHATPYIQREFHGVWANFDVYITLDSSFTVAGTGILQNPNEIGHGYLEPGKKLKRKNQPQLTWHFKAENVHDFAWAADPDYQHLIHRMEEGPEIHMFFQPDSSTLAWNELGRYAEEIFSQMASRVGPYPYSTYSIIQGGDGGMEYPMATMITGKRSLRSLVGVTAHEVIHSWFQGVLANHEGRYAWMDEGFTNYYDELVVSSLFYNPQGRPLSNLYMRYIEAARSGKEEALITHSDHFKTNYGYSIAAYVKGALFLHQLQYIIGEEAFSRGMRTYYQTWKFKHPRPDHLKAVMEKISRMDLDWYFDYWIYSTKTIDYAIDDVIDEGDSTRIVLINKGEMPMPLDILMVLQDGSQHLLHIPTSLTWHTKPNDLEQVKRSVYADWPWVFPKYELVVPYSRNQIVAMGIDPTQRLMDIAPENNYYPTDRIIFEGELKQGP